MLVFIRVIVATELGLVVCEGLAPGAAHVLPLGGSHVAQLGILLGSAIFAYEWVVGLRWLFRRRGVARRLSLGRTARP
jgi:hypothetical protein